MSAREQKEIAKLRQALWDVYAILGFDTDGNDTPFTKTDDDLMRLVVDAAREHRQDYDAACEEELRAREVCNGGTATESVRCESEAWASEKIEQAVDLIDDLLPYVPMGDGIREVATMWLKHLPENDDPKLSSARGTQ